MPAHDTANRVIASAKRLIDVRQPCLRSSRIAEISVPAWPMPIHQTKLMMAKPQPIGMLMPQIPVPLISTQVTAIPSMPQSSSPIDSTMNQLIGWRPDSTTALILSVIDPNVCPGSMSGGGGGVAGFGSISDQYEKRGRGTLRAPGWGCGGPPGTSCAGA